MRQGLLSFFIFSIATPTLAFTQTESQLIVTEYSHYASPLVRQVLPDFNRDLNIKIDWENSVPTDAPDSITGGLLRLPYMTADAVALALCHELGHFDPMDNHFLPKMKFSGLEIRSDYFATRICLPEVLSQAQTIQAFPSESDATGVPQSILKECSAKHSADEKRNICIREAKAANVIAQLLYREHFLKNYEAQQLPPPSLDRPWLGAHDFVQCRLLNMANGIFARPPLECLDLPN